MCHEGLVGQEADGPQFCFRCPDPKEEARWMFFDESHPKNWFPDWDHFSYHILMKHPEQAREWGDEKHIAFLKGHYQKKLGL